MCLLEGWFDDYLRVVHLFFIILMLLIDLLKMSQIINCFYTFSGENIILIKVICNMTINTIINYDVKTSTSSIKYYTHLIAFYCVNIN